MPSRKGREERDAELFFADLIGRGRGPARAPADGSRLDASELLFRDLVGPPRARPGRLLSRRFEDRGRAEDQPKVDVITGASPIVWP